ncbi:MAG: hypothetical protein WAK01_15850 [Methylocystis sp.]
MRRNAIAVMLFALALGLKVLLPAAAVVHVSHSPVAQTALQDCLSAATDGALGHAQTPGNGERHVASCPLCQVSCETALALLERAPQPGPRAFTDSAEPWRVSDSVGPRALLAVTHQARAPPHFS